MLRGLVYLDSNVFLYPLLYTVEVESKVVKATEILSKVVRGEIAAITSALTWDEVVWVIWKLAGYEHALKAGVMLLEFPNLKMVKVARSTIGRAQAIAEKYRLKPRGSLHVASAIEAGEREIISDDEELDRVGEVRRIPLV